MWRKFIPKMPAIKVGGRNTSAAQENSFIAAFCSMLMRPNEASSRNWRLSDMKLACSPNEVASALMLLEHSERLRSGVADGDQPVVGKHEADRGRARVAVDHSAQDADRHVERAVMVVEPARRLDLRHLGLGRDVDVDAALDQLLL